ncbi:MAG TPA: hypothetical protein ENK91_03335 [Bacteroidetes bacterium]|nr:hypothetical protein [Bacteroidota bacterium]
MSTIEIDKVKNTINIKLWLIHFKDENGIHFIHSPNLDITGYGLTKKEAKQSFEIALEEFFDYAIKNKTLIKVLNDLGWETKEFENISVNHNIFSIIKNTEFVSEIFEKYPVNSFHEKIGIPVYA